MSEGETKMDAREERGLVIATTSKIEKNKLGWKVPSQSSNGTYIVNLDHDVPFLAPDETKVKQRLLEEACEVNSKFEGYEGSRRILVIDITFCIGRNFAPL